MHGKTGKCVQSNAIIMHEGCRFTTCPADVTRNLFTWSPTGWDSKFCEDCHAIGRGAGMSPLCLALCFNRIMLYWNRPRTNIRTLLLTEMKEDPNINLTFLFTMQTCRHASYTNSGIQQHVGSVRQYTTLITSLSLKAHTSPALLLKGQKCFWE